MSIDQLRNEVDSAFQGEFMQPDIYHDNWAAIETENGTCFISISDCGMPDAWNGSLVDSGICFANVAEFYGDYVPEGVDSILEVSQCRGYGARTSAPGYLDCTEWCVFKTETEALNYLLETFAY